MLTEPHSVSLNVTRPMETPPLTEADFIAHISRGALRLTPAAVQQLVSDLPEVREQFSRLGAAGYPEVERQLHFLAEVVEWVWTDQYRDLPYGAALEAAYAVAYFVREGDLIPDTLGTIGLIDDIAVAQTVLLRNAAAFEDFSAATHVRLEAPSGRPNA